MSATHIDADLLRRYLLTRKSIAKKTERISGVAHLLSLLKHCGEPTVPACPQALANCGELIDSGLCDIIESLDEFIFLTDAEKAVNPET